MVRFSYAFWEEYYKGNILIAPHKGAHGVDFSHTGGVNFNHLVKLVTAGFSSI